MDLTRLSKTMSYALRHKPDEFNLTLDSDGWTDLPKLILALRSHSKALAGLGKGDIESAMAASDKVRFEIQGDRIRAHYGHSTPVTQIQKTPTKPPAVLFHGTKPETVDKIKASGLMKMNRQYVHLSTDAATAIKVGGRHCKKPVILVIDSFQAHKDGVEFYASNDDVWMTDDMDPKYILNFRE